MWQQLTSVSDVSVKLKLLVYLVDFLVFASYAVLIILKYIDINTDQMCAVVEVKRGEHSVRIP